MPTCRLTQLAVARLGAPTTGRIEYWDAHLPAFGLRITAAGHKSWVAMYRVKGSRQLIRETLGTISQIPGVADARALALTHLEQARAGIDPRPPRLPSVEPGTVATGREDQPAVLSVAAVAERFLQEHAERHCRPLTISEYRRFFAREVAPYWGDRPLTDIAKRDVNLLLDAKAATYPRQADEVRKHLRSFFAGLRTRSWSRSTRPPGPDPEPSTRRATGCCPMSSSGSSGTGVTGVTGVTSLAGRLAELRNC